MVVTSNTAGVSVPNNTTIVSISSNTAVLSNNVTGTGTPTFSAIGPSDTAADGGGIILDGTTDHTFTWSNANDAWQSSENLDLVNGKTYNIIDGSGNARQMLSLTQIGPTAGTGVVSGLGTGVTSSSLTSVGTLTSLSLSGNITLSSGSIFGTSGAAGVLTLRSASGNTNHSRIEVGVSEASDNGGVHVYTAGSTVATRRITIKGTSGDVLPGADNDQDLGSSSLRWANVYSGDVHLNNTGMGGNEVDGTEGNWTMQEGADDLFLINRITGKKYKFNLTEVS